MSTQSKEESVSISLTDSNGDPLTGLTALDITMYIRKGTSSPVQKVIDPSNFFEIDSINLPGLYGVGFLSLDLIRSGEFVAVIQKNGGVNLTQTNIRLELDPVEPSEDISSFGGDIRKDQSHTFTFDLFDDEDQPIHAVDPRILGAELYANGSSVSTSLTSSLQQVATKSDTASYQLTIPAGDINQSGDLVLNLGLRELLQPNFSISPQSTSTGVSGDINAIYLNEKTTQNQQGYTIQTATGYFVTSGGNVRKTNDGGQTWFTPSYSPGTGTFHDADTDRRTSFTDVFVGEVSGSPRIVYYTGSSDVSVTSSRGSGKTISVSVRRRGFPFWFVTEDSGTYYVEKTYGFSDLSASASYTGSSNEDLFDVEAVEMGTAIAVGEDTSSNDALIVRTQDGGSNWTSTTLSASTALKTVEFIPDRLIGFAAGSNGVIYETTDGGSSWSRIDGGQYSSTTWLDAYAIEKGGNRTCFFSGYDGSDARYLEYSAGQTIISSLENEIGSNRGLGITGDIQRGMIWTSTENGVVGDYGHTRPVLGIGTRKFRWHVVDREESETYTEIQNMQGSGFSSASDSLVQLDSDLSTIDSTLNTVDTKVSDIQGSGFSTSSDSLEAVRNRLDTVNTNLQSDLTSIKGSGFNSSSDSLSSIQDLIGSNQNTLLTNLSQIKGQGFTQSSDALVNVSNRVSTIKNELARVLGLSDENIKMTNYSYDQDDNVTSTTVKTYPSKQDLEQDTNSIATYEMSASYDSNQRLIDYEIKRIS